MTKQPTDPQNRLSESELDAVSHGHRKFNHEEIDGRLYAVGIINGRTVAVRID